MADAALALELARALSGEDAGDEARELASLLLAAAEPSRFAVTDAEVEQALAHARPHERRRVRPLLAVPALAAAALVAFLMLRTPGTDTDARATRAVEQTFFVVEEIHAREPGLFPATDVTGYVDGRRGRAHVRIFSPRDGAVAETLLRADGSVERWLARTNTTTIAPSCDVIPGGCGEVLDPFAFYVRALQEEGGRLDGNRLTLEGGRVDQVATIDPKTFLPRSIEWRQDGRVVATIRFVALEPQTTGVGPEAFEMSARGGTRVVQLTTAGERVRVLGAEPVQPTPELHWLGPSYRRLEQVRLTGGSATRITYDDLVVWNYGAIVPPQVLQARALPAKVFALPGGAVVHAYFGNFTRQVATVSFRDGNVAIVSLRGSNTDVVRAAQRLTRPGSP